MEATAKSEAGKMEQKPAPGPAPQPYTPDTTAKPGTAKEGGNRKFVMGALIAVVLIGGGGYGIHAYLWGKDHVETDDAFVTGNLVNIAPKISGRLSLLQRSEGDQVKQGELLARLDDSTQQAQLATAQTALDAAKSQVPQAQSNLKYQEQATQAAIQKAQSGVDTQEARIKAAQEQLQLASKTTENQTAQAKAQVAAAQATAAQIASQVQTAEATLQGQKQAVVTAERAVAALQAKVASAQADVDKDSRDEIRYKALLAREAVTQQQYDAVATQLTAAQSNLASLNEQIEQARSQVAQARSGVNQAQAQVIAARDSAHAAQQQVAVARAGYQVALAGQVQIPVQAANLAATATQTSSANADVATAQAGQTQVNLRRQQLETAKVAVKQAQAALQNAQVTEEDTYIYAPTDGTVIRKTANMGADVSAGQTILTVTQGNTVFVTANFKETQVGNVRVGQPVEIKVDAFPHKIFKGFVGSINEATGATVSLLPPDNATGNFTKVVQRVPVKIAIVPGSGEKEATADDIALLRQGMSVVATIDTKDQTPHPENVPAGYDRGGVAGVPTAQKGQ
jgi:membrane fusion protein (multidrug efflux system)